MSLPPRPPNKAAALSDLKLARALAGSEPLVGLLQRLRDSRLRFEAIAGLLPAPLLEAVRAGPLDDTAWSLLASNASAAAKLRQMLPALEAQLKASGWQGPEIKVRIQPRA